MSSMKHTVGILFASTYGNFVETPSDQVRIEVGAEVIVQGRDGVSDDVDIRLGLLMERQLD